MFRSSRRLVGLLAALTLPACIVVASACGGEPQRAFPEMERAPRPEIGRSREADELSAEPPDPPEPPPLMCAPRPDAGILDGGSGVRHFEKDQMTRPQSLAGGPPYTKAARRSRIQGKLLVRCIIRKEGN